MSFHTAQSPQNLFLDYLNQAESRGLERLRVIFCCLMMAL